MKYFCVLAFFAVSLVIPNHGFTQTETASDKMLRKLRDDHAAAEAKLNKESGEASMLVLKVRGSLKEKTTALNDAQQTLTEKSNTPGEIRCKVRTFLFVSYDSCSQEFGVPQKEFNDLKTAVDNAQAQVKEQEEDLDRVHSDWEKKYEAYEDLVAANKKTAELTQMKIEKLESEIKYVSVGSELGDLANKLDNYDETLEIVEVGADKGILGDYVRKKILNLVNSDLFCMKKDRCEQKIRIDDLDDVFPNSKYKESVDRFNKKSSK